MKNPKISVVIPVYNGERTLRQCLGSVLNQAYKNYEVIVVDNNSTDKTHEILEHYQSLSKIPFTVVFEKHKSRGAARNAGEKIAEGKIILMTDADCLVPENWIEKMIKPIVNGECDGVQGSEEPVINNFWGEQCRRCILKRVLEFDDRKVIGRIDTNNFAIATNSLRQIGFSSRKYYSGNDTELSIRFQKNNLHLKFSKEIKVKHFHVSSFNGIVEKYFYRAFWCAIITKDYKGYLKFTDFPARTNQTPWHFIKFFPGLIKTAISEGLGYAYFDFITGIAWRVGLINGWIKTFFKK